MLDNLALKAIVAYIHYLSIILCFGCLLYERTTLKINLNRAEIISIIVADSLYGISGILLLISGILRVKFFGQGPDFYTQNLTFWIKIILFALVGLSSLYPTFNYISWIIPLRKNQLPQLSTEFIDRLKSITQAELFGFLLIPFFATLMARGIGIQIQSL